MKDHDPSIDVMGRARQQIDGIALAGDREVMLHSAAHAQGWIAGLRTENLLVKEQYDMLREELESAVSKWNDGPA
jgi:Iap family predicted aminopeptidase